MLPQPLYFWHKYLIIWKYLSSFQVWNLERRSIACNLQWESNVTAFSVISGSSFMYDNDMGVNLHCMVQYTAMGIDTCLFVLGMLVMNMDWCLFWSMIQTVDSFCDCIINYLQILLLVSTVKIHRYCLSEGMHYLHLFIWLVGQINLIQ